MQIVRHRVLIFTHSGFVAERPHYYRGVVLVAFKHARYAVHERFAPFRFAHKVVPVTDTCHAVGFKIGLIAKVNAETVAKTEQTRVVGIVARAYHIYIKALEYVKIAQHVVVRGSRAEKRVAVVAVDALGFDLLTVYVEHLILYINVLEADGDAYMLAARGEAERVERRCFIRPERRLGNEHFKFPVAVKDYRAAGFLGARGGEQTVCDLLGSGRVERKFNAEHALRVFCIEHGARVDINDVMCIAEEQIDLAEYTGEAVFVLVLKV